MKTIKTASYKETIIKIASGISRVLDHMNSGGYFGIVSEKDITDSFAASSLPGASFTKGRGFVFDSDKKNTIENKPSELKV